jgi:hypothetical protein
MLEGVFVAPVNIEPCKNPVTKTLSFVTVETLFENNNLK